MSNNNKRNRVLILGSTGSLGRPIVTELLNRGIKVRLMVRSCESCAQASRLFEDTQNGRCSIDETRFDVVICSDVTERSAFKDEWFDDVCCVICVARPRSLKRGDNLVYCDTIDNLCDAVCSNHVPRLLIHGVPYLASNVVGQSLTMSILRKAENSARNRLDGSSTSLTISRICEMSEVSHIIEAVQLIGFFPCAYGYDPVLHPISSRDFATAIAEYVEDSANEKRELLVGGPCQMTWKELGKIITGEKGLQCITLPLVFFNAALLVASLLAKLFPAFDGLQLSMRLMMIPMTTNTANDKFVFIGKDTIETVLAAHSSRDDDQNGWLYQRVFNPSTQNKRSVWALPCPKRLSNVIWLAALCDGSVAFCTPWFISQMLNINLQKTAIDRILVQCFGGVSIGIAVTTFLSLQAHIIYEKGAEYAVGAGLCVHLILLGLSLIMVTDGTILLKHKFEMIVLAFTTFYLVSLLPQTTTKKRFCEVLLSSFMVCTGIATYFRPYWMLSVLFDTSIGNKTLQHSRQVSMYYIGSGIQMIALLIGVDPEKAAGILCVVCCVCSSNIWLFADVANVFHMSLVSKCVNAAFPVWSGLLAALILCRGNQFFLKK